jgi:hypothetical protein
VGHGGRNDDEVAFVGDADGLAGEDLDGTAEDVEQFGGVGVVVRRRAVAAGGQAVTRWEVRAPPVELASAKSRTVLGGPPTTSASAPRTMTAWSPPGVSNDISVSSSCCSAVHRSYGQEQAAHAAATAAAPCTP